MVAIGMILLRRFESVNSLCAGDSGIMPTDLLNSARQTFLAYFDEYGVKPRLMTPDGAILVGRRNPIDGLPFVIRARIHSLGESVRWGEPNIFFLAPGIVTWTVALVKDRQVVGGLIGGEVVAEDEPEDRLEATNHLVACGASREAAVEFVRGLPSWPQSKTQEAADRLFSLFYRNSGWFPRLLEENRERTLQQREIAEEIHRRKSTGQRDFPLREERMLLSLIRSGDRKGARKLLNRYLGAVFLQSSDRVVVHALVIELLGYLVRTAVQDSPHLGSLIESSHKWTTRIMAARDFEDLSHIVKNALDDFMNMVFLLGFRSDHPGVGRALDYIATHFRENFSLQDLAREVHLSTFRIAHLVKEQTGRTIMQHVHEMRVREALRLLEESSLSCAEIAYAVGFTDQSYFTRRFRALTGLTPRRHRRLYVSRQGVEHISKSGL